MDSKKREEHDLSFLILRRKPLDTPFDYQILKLTEVFYNHYLKELYPELLLKTGRSYNCLLIESHYGYFICVPYRTNIHHQNAFLFKGTKGPNTFHPAWIIQKLLS